MPPKIRIFRNGLIFRSQAINGLARWRAHDGFANFLATRKVAAANREEHTGTPSTSTAPTTTTTTTLTTTTTTTTSTTTKATTATTTTKATTATTATATFFLNLRVVEETFA